MGGAAVPRADCYLEGLPSAMHGKELPSGAQLRATTATLLLDSSVPIESVQDLLDHEHICSSVNFRLSFACSATAAASPEMIAILLDRTAEAPHDSAKFTLSLARTCRDDQGTTLVLNKAFSRTRRQRIGI